MLEILHKSPQLDIAQFLKDLLSIHAFVRLIPSRLIKRVYIVPNLHTYIILSVYIVR
jgi:hypothetical protein